MSYVIEATKKKIERLKTTEISVGMPIIELPLDHAEHLLKLAEIQQEAEKTWYLIENGEVKIKPEDFYSVYQDIVIKHTED